MPTSTTNFGLAKPLVNDPTDEDLWGGELNGDLDELDGLLLTAFNLTTSAKTANFSVSARTPGTNNTGDARKFFRCDATAGGITGALPAAASAGNGFIVAFKKTDITSNAVIIDGNAAEPIDGQPTLTLSSQYNSAYLVCNGTGWDILAQITPASGGGGGTITGVTAGSGLSGGGSSGTVALALGAIATSRFLANVSGSTATPTARTITEVLDAMVSSTQGAVMYRSASAWTALAPGTSGQFLKTQGGGASPIWATVTVPTPSLYGVGSYIMATGTTFYSAGASESGANLTIVNLVTSGSSGSAAFWENSGGTLTGTWMAMQNASSQHSAILWFRTA